MSFPKRLYPFLHEMHKLCGGDYNNSIEAQRYHHVHEKELDWELHKLQRTRELRLERYGSDDAIHKITEYGYSEQR